MSKFWLLLLVVSVSFTTQGKECDFGTVIFDSDFPVARLDGCKRKSSDKYLLSIEAENYPVNPSPWYAFKVTSKKRQSIDITIKYKKGKNRYLPKISHDGVSWTQIPFDIKNGKLNIKLKVNENPLWVSGQEIVGNGFYQEWAQAIADSSESNKSILGRSAQNLPIYQIESNSSSNEWVIILGRMHPPEVTGALALFPFAETLLLGSNLGTSFRERFNILVVPNMNPDGVADGNWRHNSNGMDLNRDWKKHSQKETQLVHNKLQSIVNHGGKIVYAIDFHSTSKDIFYSMPVDYGLKPKTLTNDWLQRLDNKMPEFKVIIQPGNNPSKGVFKQYIGDYYGVHAITYEMDDNQDRKMIKAIAKNAANAFMTELLLTDQKKFYE